MLVTVRVTEEIINESIKKIAELKNAVGLDKIPIYQLCPVALAVSIATKQQIGVGLVRGNEDRAVAWNGFFSIVLPDVARQFIVEFDKKKAVGTLKPIEFTLEVPNA